ncbi:MAG: peptidoglycan-binding protein LysM [Flavobacteriaceae bacterium]
MTRKWYYLLILVAGLAMAVSGFKSERELNYTLSYTEQFARLKPIEAVVPNENEVDYYDFEIPFSGRSFTAFKQAMAIRESQGRYDIVNDFGYAGKYQFGRAALRAVGISDRKEFLNNPILQEEAFKALLAINKYNLQHEINKYSGKVINGVEITESGILASAHLLGSSSVKRYLRSNGQTRIADGFGTTIRSYMKKFGNYDTSVIKPNQNAKATDNLKRNKLS